MPGGRSSVSGSPAKITANAPIMMKNVERCEIHRAEKHSVPNRAARTLRRGRYGARKMLRASADVIGVASGPKALRRGSGP